jgi:hypothetical protein
VTLNLEILLDLETVNPCLPVILFSFVDDWWKAGKESRE